MCFVNMLTLPVLAEETEQYDNVTKQTLSEDEDVEDFTILQTTVRYRPGVDETEETNEHLPPMDYGLERRERPCINADER